MKDLNETAYATEAASSTQQKGFQEIDGARARKMIDDLKNKKTKLRFYNTVWSLFDKDKMAKIYTDPTVIEVRFFVGVFPDDDTPDKKDAPVIIMRVTKTTESTLAPVYEYSLGDSYCPPPNDTSCGTTDLPGQA
jgi:hypothetical protein